MISVIIPHYPFSEEINTVLRRCTDSLKGFDELIIAVNEGTGFAKAVNQGLRVAKGDYLMVVNNDIEWKEGTLQELCIENTVTSPLLNGDTQDFWGCFFCIPRSVYEQVGGLDERYSIGYYEDDDYIMTLKKHGIPMKPVPTCSIISEGGKTMSQFSSKELMATNHKRFIEKWGQETT